jgi:hypothetical protein
MAVSVPEKTLEHWLSIHLNYRYKAKASLWWPVAGENISVADLPKVPGKQFWLEVKTTTWTPGAPSFHSLKINLWQLWKYGNPSHNPACVPDYYVFPIPPFDGHIGDRGLRWLGGTRKSWIGYESKSRRRWFARWMRVIPGAELRRLLASELTAWEAVMDKRASFELAQVVNGNPTWATPLAGVDELSWHDFLARMDSCGRPGWGSLLVTPRSATRRRPRSSIKTIFIALSAADNQIRNSREKPHPDAEQQVTYWVPSVDDDYVALDEELDLDTELASPDEPESFRSLVTLRYDVVK